MKNRSTVSDPPLQTFMKFMSWLYLVAYTLTKKKNPPTRCYPHFSSMVYRRIECATRSRSDCSFSHYPKAKLNRTSNASSLFFKRDLAIFVDVWLGLAPMRRYHELHRLCWNNRKMALNSGGLLLVQPETSKELLPMSKTDGLKSKLLIPVSLPLICNTLDHCSTSRHRTWSYLNLHTA